MGLRFCRAEEIRAQFHYTLGCIIDDIAGTLEVEHSWPSSHSLFRTLMVNLQYPHHDMNRVLPSLRVTLTVWCCLGRFVSENPLMRNPTASNNLLCWFYVTTESLTTIACFSVFGKIPLKRVRLHSCDTEEFTEPFVGRRLLRSRSFQGASAVWLQAIH